MLLIFLLVSSRVIFPQCIRIKGLGWYNFRFWLSKLRSIKKGNALSINKIMNSSKSSFCLLSKYVIESKMDDDNGYKVCVS